MIVGIGTDLVVVERFERVLERRPAIGERLLTEGERGRSIESMAARFAAKEALAKALGSPGGMRWLDCEVVRDEHGRPRFEVRGTVEARVRALGIESIHVSLSHDGGFAIATVVCEA